MLLPGTSRPLGPAYDANGLVKVLEDVGYSLEAELKNLWELTKHPDPKIALAAQGRWRSTLKDIRLANAVLLTMTRKDDGQVERSATAMAMMDQLAAENTNAKKQITHEYHAPTAGSARPDQAPEPPKAVFPGEIVEGARDPAVKYSNADANRLADAVRRKTSVGAGERLASSRKSAAAGEPPAQPEGGTTGP